MIGVVILVVVVVVVVAALAASASVQVTGINWTGSDSCGGVAGTSTGGFTATSGSTYTYSVTGLDNLDPIFSCTIHSVVSTTAGFAIRGGDLPLTIPASGRATLTVDIGTPGSFDGVLSLSVN